MKALASPLNSNVRVSPKKNLTLLKFLIQTESAGPLCRTIMFVIVTSFLLLIRPHHHIHHHPNRRFPLFFYQAISLPP